MLFLIDGVDVDKEGRRKPVKINKVGVVLIAVGASAIAYTPAAMLMQHPIFLVYIAVGAALISIISVRKHISQCTEAPSFAEFLLAGLDSISTPALVGLGAMALYGIVFGLSVLVELLARLFGGHLVVNAGLIALWPTAIFGALMCGVVCAAQLDDLKKRLYPDTAGIRSDYFQYFTTNRSKLIGSVTGTIVPLVTLVVLLVTHALNETIAYAAIQFLLFIMGTLFSPETSLEKAEEQQRIDTVERLKRLLDGAGYVTELNPRTGDAGIDPLLMNLDILARRDKQNLMLDVRSSSDVDKELDWRAASTLVQSASLLAAQKGIDTKNVDARLVLVDMKPDRSLKEFSKIEDVPLIHIGAEQIRQIENATANEQRIALESLLGLPAESKPSPRRSKKAARSMQQ